MSKFMSPPQTRVTVDLTTTHQLILRERKRRGKQTVKQKSSCGICLGGVTFMSFCPVFFFLFVTTAALSVPSFNLPRVKHNHGLAHVFQQFHLEPKPLAYGHVRHVSFPTVFTTSLRPHHAKSAFKKCGGPRKRKKKNPKDQKEKMRRGNCLVELCPAFVSLLILQLSNCLLFFLYYFCISCVSAAYDQGFVWSLGQLPRLFFTANVICEGHCAMTSETGNNGVVIMEIKQVTLPYAQEGKKALL